jgi:putative tryptophan/tyrosine transport system substrate-binding protein
MERRTFITLIGGAAASPFAARAQQQTHPLIGFLSSRSVEDTKKFVEAFRDGLRRWLYRRKTRADEIIE